MACLPLVQDLLVSLSFATKMSLNEMLRTAGSPGKKNAADRIKWRLSIKGGIKKSEVKRK